MAEHSWLLALLRSWSVYGEKNKRRNRKGRTHIFPRTFPSAFLDVRPNSSATRVRTRFIALYFSVFKGPIVGSSANYFTRVRFTLARIARRITPFQKKPSKHQSWRDWYWSDTVIVKRVVFVQIFRSIWRISRGVDERCDWICLSLD